LTATGTSLEQRQLEVELKLRAVPDPSKAVSQGA
jgi:hypothetical protein